MISPDEFTEIVAAYEKHGWLLRRVLLTSGTRKGQLPIPDHVTIFDSDIDAAWFSRSPQAGAISWEIRSLGATPFALVEFIDEDSAEFEQVLADVAQRMAEVLAQRKRLDN